MVGRVDQTASLYTGNDRLPSGRATFVELNGYMPMSHSLAFALASMVAAANAQVVAPGRWDVTSTVVVLSIPGVPGFLVRMMRGKSKAEHKRVAMGQGIEQLLLPDQKAQCLVESQHVADGRYAQTVSCPQKRGEPLNILRTGTYDRSGFMGDAIITGITPKGAMKIVLKQRAVRIGD